MTMVDLPRQAVTLAGHPAWCQWAAAPIDVCELSDPEDGPVRWLHASADMTVLTADGGEIDLSMVRRDSIDGRSPAFIEIIKDDQGALRLDMDQAGLLVAAVNYFLACEEIATPSAAETFTAGAGEAFTAKFAEMLRREQEFDRTRLPCPDWCDKTCTDEGHFGDAIIHQVATSVPSTADRLNEPDGSVWITARRHESLDDGIENEIELDVADSRAVLPDSANLSAAQARALAAELLRHADLIDPEPKVAAVDVHVGDWLKVGDDWLRIYSVTVDEPTDSVQLYTTVDWEQLPEFGGDEEPHEFKVNDLVRVRRDPAYTAAGLATNAGGIR